MRYRQYIAILCSIMLLGTMHNSIAQINEGEGINMPGGWDSWNQPPSVNALASEQQVDKHTNPQTADINQAQSSQKTGTITFYFKAPDWMDNDPNVPQVGAQRTAMTTIH